MTQDGLEGMSLGDIYRERDIYMDIHIVITVLVLHFRLHWGVFNIFSNVLI